jgi:tetratricopeptide (TPR) repeat protein
VARCATISLTIKAGLVMLCLYLASSGTIRAQNSGRAPNAIVAVDSLAVYPEMSESGSTLQLLKKGDAVIIELEFRTTEQWCSIKRPSQASRLGYVLCQGLERIVAPTSNASAGSGTRVLSEASPSKPSSSKDVSLPAPSARINGYDQIASLAVREGAIDTAKMFEFDRAAREGSPAAMSRAALAHFAAGKFELSRSNFDEAIEQFQSSLNFSTSSSELQINNLLTLAYIDLIRSQYSDALGYLDHARRLAPRRASVAQLAGWAYYGLNQIDDAIKEWRIAQQIEPSPDIASSLAKAERDKAAESETREANSSHFMLRYQGSATPALATDILSVLEEDFRSLVTEFRFTPAEPIGVVLYTEQSFRDVSQLPSWARASNDGRIRVPVQGLTSVPDLLSRMLMHELVHSFVRQKTLGRCPTWLNEGLAQWFEGRRSNRTAAGLAATFDRGQYIPLQRLDGSWDTMSGPTADFAYAWSLAAVEYIMSNSGMWGIGRLFERFDMDPNFESALRVALQIDYADLERQTVAYLRQTYGK